MYTYDHKIRVRYADVDQMGYVYYGNYGYYYEQARAEAIRAVGITYKEVEESGTIMPVIRMNIKYIQPAFYDELLTVRTTIPRQPNRIIVFEYDVLNEKGILINQGETHIMFLDSVTKKIKSVPDIFFKTFHPYFKF